MAFREQQLGNFIDAVHETTKRLQKKGLMVSPQGINLNEGLILQAASHLLQETEEQFFYGIEARKLVDLPNGTFYPALRRLETRYTIFTSQFEKRNPNYGGRSPRRLYRSTRFGRGIVNLFQYEPIKKDSL